MAEGRKSMGAERHVEALGAPDFNPWLRKITPYKAGESGGPNSRRMVKLSANENPLGPSPAGAIDAFRRSADTLAVYPSSGAAQLRGAIAAEHGLDADRIVCGAGSDELISMLCLAFAAPGE